MSSSAPKENYSTIVSTLQRNWIVGFGALVLPIILAIFISKYFIPFVAFLEVHILNLFIKSEFTTRRTSCSMVLRLCSRALLFSGIIMLFICVVFTDFIIPTVIHLPLYNPEIPFLTVLVIFPVISIFCAYTLTLGIKNQHCRKCQALHGIFAGENHIGTFYYVESRHQLFILLFITSSISVIAYWYYFFRYFNVNINAPDRFFFSIIPIAIYLISIVVMSVRYLFYEASFSEMYKDEINSQNRSKLRFLILRGDEILLKRDKDNENRWETPAFVNTFGCNRIPDEDAKKYFAGIMGFNPPAMKYCFTHDSLVSSLKYYHYVVFVGEDYTPEVTDDTKWFTIKDIEQISTNGTISKELGCELYRIITMATMWKTYHKDGTRIYPIKGYRPGLRLRDIQKWDLDYDNLVWLEVAHNNADTRFFRLRHLRKRIVDFFVKHRNKANL